MNTIADVQSTHDMRNQSINRVGIRGLRLPLRLSHEEQATVATVAMSVYLPAEQKGTHMSRFVALIESFDEVIDYDTLKLLTHTMLRDLDSNAGEIEIQAPFFRTKTAPISSIKSLMDYDITLTGSIENNL